MGPKKRPNPLEKARERPSVPFKNPFQSEIKLGSLQSSEPSLPSPQGQTHPMSAAVVSHDTNRKKCCLICYTWTKIELPDSLKSDIPRIFETEIDFSDRKVPLGMCSTCKIQPC